MKTLSALLLLKVLVLLFQLDFVYNSSILIRVCIMKSKSLSLLGYSITFVISFRCNLIVMFVGFRK